MELECAVSDCLLGAVCPESWLPLSPCRQRLEAAEAENGALRRELTALDPEFFEEVEDLKWAHHLLQQRSQYEGLVAGLAAELGQSPPAVAVVATHRASRGAEGILDFEQAIFPMSRHVN